MSSLVHSGQEAVVPTAPGIHSTDPVMDAALQADAEWLAAMGQDAGPTLADLSDDAATAAHNQFVRSDVVRVGCLAKNIADSASVIYWLSSHNIDVGYHIADLERSVEQIGQLLLKLRGDPTLALVEDLLSHSVSHYGYPSDETHGVGETHAKARAFLAKAKGEAA